MPQAILLKDVEGLGEAGSVVDVSPGLPAQLPRSEPARAGRHRRVGRRRPARAERAETAARETEERAQETAALLGKTVLTISHRAGEDGSLFGSVTAKEIADAVRQARGLKLDHRKVRLEEPIRELGTHMVEIEVAPGVTTSVKTMVVEAK